VRLVRNRTIEGFDVTSPTVGEHPELLLGRIAAALVADPDAGRVRSDAVAADLRELVPADQRAAFDDLVAEARYVYRLRDERGLYSEVTAIGLLRRTLLEIGRRAHERGQLASADLTLDATVDEVKDLVSGGGPASDELAQRGATRRALTAAGPPRHLGPPPPPPPPMDELPPPMARMMSAVGFMIESILGQLDAVEGDDTVIGGIGVGENVAEGPARLVSSIDDLLDVEPGDIIVAPSTTEAFNSVLHLVAGIVTDHGSHACHAAIVAREMGFPAVVGTVDGTKRIPAGARVRLDGAKGEVAILP
jgi:pyruvate,water dikinase